MRSSHGLNFESLMAINYYLLFQDDFLLRHYDSGKCKGKLGHTRASLLWHRAQGNLLRGIDKKTIRREGISIYSLLSNTLFIRVQNGSKLQSFLYMYNFFQFSEWKL